MWQKVSKKNFFSKFDDFFHTEQNEYIMIECSFSSFPFFAFSAKFLYNKKKH